MIRLIVDGLVKRYNGVAVVEEASLEVLPGELAVVLGPSGAGKSTLARLIAGLESLDAGEIYFDGRVVHPLSARERRVGFVFQGDALWPHLSVAEHVHHALKAHGVGRRERRQRVADILGTVGIESLADKRTDELSPLQRQRVALARALVVEPELLLVDEPFGPLDARGRSEFRDDLRRLHAETERTSLILTHEPREALCLASRLAVMDLGKIIQVGPPIEIYNKPADAFVAQFLGPTNLLQGKIEGTDARGGLVVRTPIGRLVGCAAAPEIPLPDGTPVTVAIRPEAFHFGPNLPVDANRFVATVERQTFFGESRQVLFRGPGDWPITAFALQCQSGQLREGQNLTVAVPPEWVVVLLGRYATAPTV